MDLLEKEAYVHGEQAASKPPAKLFKQLQDGQDKTFIKLFVDSKTEAVFDIEDPNAAVVRQMYGREIAEFAKGNTTFVNGTPLDMWVELTSDQRAMLNFMNVQTIEQVARWGDGQCEQFGMGGMDIKNKAVEWLSRLEARKVEREAQKEIAELQAQLAERDGRIASLEGDVSEMKELMQGLLAQAKEGKGNAKSK